MPSQSTSWRPRAEAATGRGIAARDVSHRSFSPTMKTRSRLIFVVLALVVAQALAGCASVFEADAKAPLVQDKVAVPLTPNVLGGAGGPPN
jgi:hypothetical protein